MKILEKLPPQYDTIKRQYLIAMSSTPNIDFHGHVVDQYNKPLPNAKVHFTGTSGYLSGGGGRGYLLTDSKGYFELESSGEELLITGIIHNDVIDANHLIFYSRKAPGREDKFIWTNYDSKDTAYQFTTWRLGEYEGAIERNAIFRTGINETYAVNLLGPSRHKGVDVQQGLHPDAQLNVSCSHIPIPLTERVSDWKASIRVQNGGIQYTTDQYLNLAPDTGYQASFDINMKKGDKNFKRSFQGMRFYFTSYYKDKPIYGSFILEMVPFTNRTEGTCRLMISSQINPTGSRNLELKQKKRSDLTLPVIERLARKD